MLLDLHCFHLINPQGGRGSKTAFGCRKKNAARSSSKPIQCVYLRTYKYEHQTTKKIETGSKFEREHEFSDIFPVLDNLTKQFTELYMYMP